MQITVILTCFNRKDKTVNCIESLYKGNPDYNLFFVVVDDSSNDGTYEALMELDANLKIIKGNGKLFWSGGMRVGIDWFLKNDNQSEYVLLVNDDVIFNDGIIRKLLTKSKRNRNAVIAGATCDENGCLTYGALVLKQPIKRGIYRQVKIDEKDTVCDLFNCNCVLIKSDIVKKVGNFDSVYVHGLADLDYGLRLSRLGYLILSSDEYVGICEKNTIKGTWQDTSLSRIDRLKKKESQKGAPFRPWFHYVYKNFGLFWAIRYSLGSYWKILIGR